MKTRTISHKRGKGNNGKNNNTVLNRLTLKNVFIIIGFVLATVILFCYIVS